MAEEDVQELIEEEKPTMDLNEAMRDVFKRAALSGKLFKGINQAVRAIERKEANACFFAGNCENKEYLALLEALCKEKNVILIKVSTREALGQLAGLFKLDPNGEPKKIVKTSSVAVFESEAESEAWKMILHEKK